MAPAYMPSWDTVDLTHSRIPNEYCFQRTLQNLYDFLRRNRKWQPRVLARAVIYVGSKSLYWSLTSLTLSQVIGPPPMFNADYTPLSPHYAHQLTPLSADNQFDSQVADRITRVEFSELARWNGTPPPKLAPQVPGPSLSGWSVPAADFTPPASLPPFDSSISTNNSFTDPQNLSWYNGDVAHAWDVPPYWNFDAAQAWPMSGAPADCDDPRRFHEALELALNPTALIRISDPTCLCRTVLTVHRSKHLSLMHRTTEKLEAQAQIAFPFLRTVRYDLFHVHVRPLDMSAPGSAPSQGKRRRSASAHPYSDFIDCSRYEAPKSRPTKKKIPSAQSDQFSFVNELAPPDPAHNTQPNRIVWPQDPPVTTGPGDDANRCYYGLPPPFI
ncbi:hypothetical protein C8R46DRAFT_1220924 [Mycena filopes]|nr:hypothetical protein C8R46DRAFT_1220924 [Mycena filopes]